MLAVFNIFKFYKATSYIKMYQNISIQKIIFKILWKQLNMKLGYENYVLWKHFLYINLSLKKVNVYNIYNTENYIRNVIFHNLLVKHFCIYKCMYYTSIFPNFNYYEIVDLKYTLKWNAITPLALMKWLMFHDFAVLFYLIYNYLKRLYRC